MFTIPKKCLKLAGNIEGSKMIHKILQASLVAALLACFLFFFLLIPRDFKDISKTASAFGLGTTAFLSLVKIFKFYPSKKMFYELMEKIEEYEKRGLNSFT
jgi:hypothetical protein